MKGNAAISEKQFPLGVNRPKFLFVDGLRMLGEGDAKGCTENMQLLIEKYPKSEVSEIAGMIVKGVKEGRTLLGGAFDSGSIWERRAVNVEETDSTATDTLSASPIEKDFLGRGPRPLIVSKKESFAIGGRRIPTAPGFLPRPRTSSVKKSHFW